MDAALRLSESELMGEDARRFGKWRLLETTLLCFVVAGFLYYLPRALVWLPYSQYPVLGVAFVGVPLVWEWAAGPDTIRQMGLNLPTGRQPWLILLTICIASVAHLEIVCWLLRRHIPPFCLSDLLYIVPLSACSAVTEEFFFRSILQRRLTVLWGGVLAILFTALLFAFALHWRAWVLDNALLRFPIAVMLGWLFVRQESLLGPVLVHFIYDLACLRPVTVWG